MRASPTHSQYRSPHEIPIPGNRVKRTAEFQPVAWFRELGAQPEHDQRRDRASEDRHDQGGSNRREAESGEQVDE